jgi:4-amino-4-deoxy-L-arabinose transferase-like glycosyltransferase
MRPLTREHTLWIGVALLAGATRLFGLGAPMADAEAHVALSSLAAARGESVALLNPLFGLLQTLSMTLFGSSEAVARIVSALAGTVFCLLPFLARRQLGSLRALLLGLLLALSPTAMFVARQASGEMLAWTLATGVLMLDATHKRARVILVGLLLACGVDAPVPAISTLLLVLLLDGPSALVLQRRDFATLGAGFLLGASGVLVRLTGVSDVFNGYAAWLRQFGMSTGFGSDRLLAGFLVNELSLVIFGMIGSVLLLWRSQLAPAPRLESREQLNDLTRALALVAVSMFGIALYPGRTPGSILPMVLGVSLLAAYALAVLIDGLGRSGTWMDWAIAGVCFVLMQFTAVMLRQFANSADPELERAPLVAVMLCAALVLAAGINGDWRSGVRGLGTALGASLLLYSGGTAMQLTRERLNHPGEPYVLFATSERMGALAETLRTAAIRATGEPDAAPLVIDPTAPPALRWALREQSRAQLSTDTGSLAIDAAVMPADAKPAGQRPFIGSQFEVQQVGDLSRVRCNIVDNRAGWTTFDKKLDCAPLARWFVSRELAQDGVTGKHWTLWFSKDFAARASGVR